MEESAGREINYLRLSVTDIPEESRVLALDRQSIALSPGSACRSGSPNPSHALLAMGLSEDQAHCAIRLSLGAWTTPLNTLPGRWQLWKRWPMAPWSVCVSCPAVKIMVLLEARG